MTTTLYNLAFNRQVHIGKDSKEWLYRIGLNQWLYLTQCIRQDLFVFVFVFFQLPSPRNLTAAEGVGTQQQPQVGAVDKCYAVLDPLGHQAITSSQLYGVIVDISDVTVPSSRSGLIRGEMTILNMDFDVLYADIRSKQYRKLEAQLLSTVSACVLYGQSASVL